MRIVTAFKLLFALLVITLLSIFYVQNTGKVDIQFPFGRPYAFGLIHSFIVAYLLGVITTVYVTLVINAKIRKKRKLEESKELIEED